MNVSIEAFGGRQVACAPSLGQLSTLHKDRAIGGHDRPLIRQYSNSLCAFKSWESDATGGSSLVQAADGVLLHGSKSLPHHHLTIIPSHGMRQIE